MLQWFNTLLTGSIRRQLALGIATVHAVLMTVFVYDLVERQRDFLMAHSLDEARSLAAAFAANSVSWVLADDLSGLQEIVRSQLRAPNLRYAMLLSPQGRVLGHTSPEKAGMYVSDPVSLKLTHIHSPVGHILVDDVRLVDVAEPILADGQLIGWARVGINQGPIADSLAMVTRKGLNYAAAAIALGVVFAILMARGLTSAMRRLAWTAIRVQEGNLDERARISRGDEIGGLAVVFNRMLDALRDQAVAREAALRELARSQAEFAAMFRAIPDAVILTDTQRHVRVVNPAAIDMFGYTEEELCGNTAERIYSHHEDFEAVEHLRLDSGATSYSGDVQLERCGGQVFQGQIVRAPVRDSAGIGIGYIALFRDISTQKAAEEQLRLAASVFSHAHEGILITDANGIILEANETFRKLTGYSLSELRGRDPSVLKSGRHDTNFYRSMWSALADHGYWHGDLWNRRANGSLYSQLTSISAVYDHGGKLSHYICLASDITALKDSQQMLEQMAYFDPLTKLPNRTLLADRLHQAMAQCRRNGRLLAVCYLDLDNFKPVNDRWGHAAGDKLLIAVAQRLRQNLRDGDTVARMGGDEFVVLLGGLESVAECETSLQRLRESLQKPFTLEQGEVNISASLGVSLFPNDSGNPHAIIRHADKAMYLAKQAGRNRLHLFDPELDRETRSRKEAQGRIRQGLSNGEFVLYYQPKVDMRHGRIFGAEALIRWQHPEKGLASPAEFLPLAENTKLCQNLDLWVLETAIRQLDDWFASGTPLSVSVNISARLLQTADFMDRLRDLLNRHANVPSTALELEILETTAQQNIDHVSRLIHECQQLGVQFALDDFGTGYSSLSYLKHLPVHTLKIDRCFVGGMLTDEEDRTMVRGVIGLAQAFRRQVIAEGVETVAHGVTLLRLGCELAQGYAIAPPMPAADLPGWMRGWRPPAEWSDALREEQNRLFRGDGNTSAARSIVNPTGTEHASLNVHVAP